ncbi:AbrB/MazE/SpoVT family DNA-binding domain-containing protein [Stetteria hydrogenophila]
MPRGDATQRKVQRLGASSLIITLPRGWARRHNIDVGDIVYVHDVGDKLVVSPEPGSKPASITLKLNGVNGGGVFKHLESLALCTYLYGFDELYLHPASYIRDQVVEKITEALKGVEGASVNVVGNNDVVVEFGEPRRDYLALLSKLGRSVGAIFRALAESIESGRFDLDYYTKLYGEASRLSSKLLRSTSAWRPVEVVDDRVNKIIGNVIVILSLLASTAYRLAATTASLYPGLKRGEVERITLLLQALEVAVTTMGSSADPPSIKKVEEAHSKIRQILNVEDELAEVVASGSPAFAFILAKILEAARLAELASQALLCICLIKKHGSDNTGHAAGDAEGERR